MIDPLLVIAATGNRFALVDGFVGPAPSEPSTLAMKLGDDDELAIDGLLQLLPPEAGGDCRMLIHNVDGTRAEMCGNGLRCVARVAVERGHVPGPSLVVETDAGPRTVEVVKPHAVDGAALVRASLGVPVVSDLACRLVVREGEVEAALVSLGNPHCVLFVPDVLTTPVGSIGRQLERHAHFPERTNVEFVDVRPGELAVRIWERGVGETGSCGTGVAAAVVAAIAQGRTRSPVRVHTRGGSLVVTWDGRGEVALEGEVAPPERALDPSLCR